MTADKQAAKPAYQLDGSEVLAQQGSRQEGLSDQEAAERLVKYGRNELERVNRESGLLRFLRQFKDLMIVLLIASAGIALYLEDYRTSSILLIIVLINAGIGFWQEHKAENIMASLEKLVVASAKVRRGGQLVEISTAELVPGDVLYIAEGDSVPADARILHENELSTNDFAMTGESNPSRKFTHAIQGETELGRRHNLVFMGTTVATGDGFCVVIDTAMRTELGRIANLSQTTKSDLSPLQKEMNHLAKRITQGTLILASLLTAISLSTHASIHDAFIFAIAIASAMIPQGLPAEVNTALTSAANRLAKAKALVKKLSAVETLGSTNIIATDKTGTLTKNEMTVEQLYIGNTSYLVSGAGYENNGQILDHNQKPLSKGHIQDEELFFVACIFASNASIGKPDSQHGDWYVLGDPTEGALITMARKAGFDDIELNKQNPEIYEHTFDSVRKRMSSQRNYNGPKIFCKGAPESVLEVCSHILVNGHIRKLTAKDRQLILARNELLAGSALRNLAIAYKELPAKFTKAQTTMTEAESDLVFLGMASMIDPPREEVPEAMRAAARAHIPVSIITGDNSLTATAIAIKAGLASHAKELTIVLGEELRTMDDSQVARLLVAGKVIFSRVAPEDKLRIVDLGKSIKKVVAVTGDGINDAPALKRADIGVAMGVTGTDVAKQSADIVLLDDSFKTLVGAIQEGRIIFQNIKKATLSCLTSNTGELFTVLISLLAVSIWHIPIAISAILILSIDLMAELFPIAALGWDRADGELMDDPPRDPRQHILNPRNIADLAVSGLLIGSLAYANYLFFIHRHDVEAVDFNTKQAALYASAITLTYVTICFCQFANILARRTRTYRQSFFSSYLWSNRQLLIAFGMSMIGILAIVYVPVVNRYAGSGRLELEDWALALTAALLYLILRWLTAHRFHKPTLAKSS